MASVRLLVTDNFDHEPSSSDPGSDAGLGGRICTLSAGQMIGRSRYAGLRIDNPRISEAHALLSQRDGLIHLLALRRRFTVEGRKLEDVALTDGLLVELAPGVSLEVIEVMPAVVPAIRGPGLHCMVLPDVASIVAAGSGQPYRVVMGIDDDARAILWLGGDGPRVRIGASTQRLAPGQSFEVDGHRFEIVDQAAHALDVVPTLRWEADPLTFIARWDTLHILREGNLVLAFDGVAARIMSELLLARVPLDWQMLAMEVWSGHADATALRGRLDVNLGRIRRKLKDAGLSADLVRATGAGQIEIMLGPEDVVVDET